LNIIILAQLASTRSFCSLIAQDSALPFSSSCVTLCASIKALSDLLFCWLALPNAGGAVALAFLSSSSVIAVCFRVIFSILALPRSIPSLENFELLLRRLHAADCPLLFAVAPPRAHSCHPHLSDTFKSAPILFWMDFFVLLILQPRVHPSWVSLVIVQEDKLRTPSPML